MLLATNPNCNTVLHHLVADTVEVCGGSRQLIKILNRLGMCVSTDTHDRLVTYVAEKQKTTEPFSELSPHTFTVASADNIDFLSSHAAVYCGNKLRSYHGTTIQFVQPVPSLRLSTSVPLQSELNEQASALQEISINTVNQLSSKRHHLYSPSTSPHKLGKVGPKRKRTMTVSSVQVSELSRLSQSLQMYAAPTHQQNLVLSQFFESDDEKLSNTRISKEMFSYFFQKFLFTSTTGEERVMKHLREFLLPTAAQLSDHDSSIIYYLELVDENADSFETMSFVAETVIEKMRMSFQKSVVLVGDGKTYVHLQKAKRVYSHELKHLFIYPGDWHILKNLQEVLMKGYYHAGLKEIAMESGYRSETLNSLERCSNFKRTHSFLSQVWEALYLEMIRAFSVVNPEVSLLKEKLDSIIEKGLSPQDHLLSTHHVLNEAMSMQVFFKFIDDQSQADDTWKLWLKFVFCDCFCYISLFLAIRTSNWQLRMSSLKQIAPLFSAYDRPCYQRLIPDHIADVIWYKLSQDQLEPIFKKPCFSSRIELKLKNNSSAFSN